MKGFFLFFLVVLYPLRNLHLNHPERVVVWSVGQGQMVTYSGLTSCVHFDMGGEKFPLRKLIKECGLKNNQVFFSHWDWDHINFARKAFARLRGFCMLNSPKGKIHPKKQSFLSVIPLCQKKEKGIFKEIVFSKEYNRDKKATSSNKSSRVVVVKRKVLIPGDSPGSSERLWGPFVKDPVEVLVVGHHGSRFSTTLNLLRSLPHLKLAIASARKKRYGHPHADVKRRLAQRGIPLLSTEHFHHIVLPLRWL